MLASFRQPFSCTCSCLLKNTVPGSSVITRKYQNPNTAVLERMHPVGLVGVGKYPLLKRRHYILKRIESPKGLYKKTMPCILTREIDGIGLKGTLVEVKKNLFRNELYPKGYAVYASPENIQFYEKYRKTSDEEGIDYESKMLMKKMAGYHLRVFMNAVKPWTLSATHIRVAFRKMGVGVDESNIIMPKWPVSKPGDFNFQLQMDNKMAVMVRGTIYELLLDGIPDPDMEYPSEWDNPPINPDNVIEFLKKKTENMNISEGDTAMDSNKVEEPVTDNIGKSTNTNTTSEEVKTEDRSPNNDKR